MRGVRHLVGAVIVFGTVLLGVGESSGQVLGTFRWRFSPFCNVVTLTVIQQGPALSLSGFDDDCGFTNGSAASGTLFVTGGTVGGSVTIIGPGGVAVNNLIQVIPTTGSGTWSDNFGNSGAFTFNPATAPGSQRPVVNENVFAFGQIRENASIRNSSSALVSVDHPTTGIYCLNFSPTPSQTQLEGSVVGLSGSGTAALFARVSNGQGGDCPTGSQLNVRIVNASGTLTDGRFTFIVPR